ncbi:radical SAM protein [Sorangium sp. So ce281]|uniref:B12-binding domain-containing radical SAM protein n=1 Tax=unclassified Sorangium TaxID=2621164 RepID=UPI003F601F7A
MNATDPEVLDRNNEHYLSHYREMIPTLGEGRLEIVDAVNHVRRSMGSRAVINEHNSSALNGVYIYNFLCRSGYDGRVELVDNMDLEPERARQLVEAVDIVVFSTTFITSADTIVRVVRVLKSWNPRVKVVVGGAKLTQFAHDSEIHESAKVADALVLSPNGETTLLHVIERLHEGRPISDLPNIAYYDGQFVRSPVSSHDGVDINTNHVQWSALPSYILRSSVNMRTGRGCPFKCKFCTFPSYNDQNVDLMTTETILEELRDISKMPQIKSVRFVDDTLFLSRRQLIDVCKGMINMGFSLPWTAYLRASTLTEECVRYLKDAGCKLVLVGIESADQQVLDNMLKGTREEHNWMAAENLQKFGVLGFAFVLLGFPGETEKSVGKTIKFLNEGGFHAYVHSPLFVFPNSPVAREAAAFGLRGGFNDWSHDTMTCREAIDQCRRVFQEVTNSAYIDRGSSITKILLDHGYSVDEVRQLGILHNSLAREEMNGGQKPETLKEFTRMAFRAEGEVSVTGKFTSPYSRTGGALQINSSARY